MTKLYHLILLSVILLKISSGEIKAQSCSCNSSVPTYTVNFSANADTTYDTPSYGRNSQCCGADPGPPASNCIRFILIVNSKATEVNFDVSHGKAGFYQVDCGTSTPLRQKACLGSADTVCITYCSNGGGTDVFTLTTSSGFSIGAPVNVRSGCAGQLSITGLVNVNWTSISPASTYTTYLSSTTVASPTVTPTSSTPSSILYQACGDKVGCASNNVCDTERVNVTPALVVAPTATNTVICTGGSNVTISANASGGKTPYTYSWNTGATTSTISAAAGTYTISVNDNTAGCGAVTQTITIASQATPSPPSAGSNSPVCEGQTLSLTASSTGTTYAWTGPSAFSSSSQNPTIASMTTAKAGTYSVTATTNGCTSSTATTSVTVNTTPAAPVAGSNSTVCSGQTLSLTASSTGSTYSWNGPTGFSSSSQNPTRASVSTADAGTYSVTATSAAGCTSTMGTTSVSINQTPSVPSASSNSTVCSGQTLSLAAGTIASATYSWNGPGFSSALQNPTISSVTTAANGTYSVTATVNGCTSIAGTTTVTINQTPSAPTAGSNSTVCSGNTLSLTASTISGATYSWTGPNSFSDGNQNPTIGNVSTAATGTYSVIATVAGCPGSAGTTSVTINQTPGAPTAGSNSTVCSGNTLSLTASTISGATYSWNGPTGFSSALQNPTRASVSTADAGTYSVTATVAGCTGAAGTTAVTINQTPSAPTAGNNSPICAGSTLSLTASSAGTSYSWNGPGFSSALQNPTIAGVSTAASGTYSVTATAGGCTGLAGTTTVTVNPIPAAPTAGSNSTVCSGNTLSLTASTISGATYSWNGPTGFSSALQNPTRAIVSTADAGTYSVTATVAGCTGIAGTTSVTINQTPSAPTAGSNSAICAGLDLSLTASTISGATYSWSGPSAYSSASQNPVITNAGTVNSGTYSVTATVAGCTGIAGTTSVTVNPIPVAPTAGSNSTVCSGNTLSLTASTISGATYSWSGPTGFSSALQNPTRASVSTADAGTYSVTATVAGCTGAAGTTAVTINQTPSAPTAGNNSPICAGTTLSLTASSVGTSYSWNGPNGFSSALQNPTIANVQTVNAGTYSVTATAGGCTGISGTTSVTINPIPAAPTAGSNSTVCSGNTLSLTASTISGATYSWSGPGGYSSSSQNPTISNAQTTDAGTYSVTATVAGCTGTAGTTAVAITQTPSAPTAGNNSPICTGTTLSLTANTISGATYSWSGPNGFSSALQNPTIASAGTVNAGTYSVTATVAGCAGAAGTTSATITSPPATPSAGSNSTVCTGYTLSLTASTISGATYNWSGPNGFSSSSQNPTVPAVTTSDAGTYSVTATVAGCTGSVGTTSVAINVSPASPTAGSNTPVCSGNTLSLTASTVAGVSSYSWNGPNSFSSALQNTSIANVTTAATGTYSLTAIAANGCGSTPVTTITVTINETPSAPIAGSNTPVCLGGDLSLTANTIAGASYSWTGPNSFSSALQNPVRSAIIASDAGSYSVTATVAGCTGNAGSTSVVVNAAPPTPAPGSNSPVCTGQTLSLTTAAVASGSYNWSGPNGFSSTLQNPTRTNVPSADAGTYSVFVTVPGCASSATGTVAVTVNVTPAAPTAGGNSPVCSGQNISLTASTIGSSTYSWSGPNGFISSSQDTVLINVSTAASGIYSVTATENGCTGLAGTKSITVNQTPVAPTATSNSPLCTGTILSLTASSTGTTYSWNGPNGFSSALQNPTRGSLTIADDGTYSVTATTNGCTGPAGTVSVTITAPQTTTPGSNTPICSGQTLSLTASSVAGATYSWTGPNGFSSSLQDPTISSAPTANSGTYSVTVTVAGCTGSTATTSVTVNPTPSTPSPGSNSPVCVGFTLSLTSNTIAGVTYSWTGPGGFSSASQNPPIANVQTSDAGTYSLSVTSIANSCVSNTATISVTVNTIPSSPIAGSNSSICSGQTLSLTASTVGGATYSWNGPGGFSSSSQNPTITNAPTSKSGTYSVTATVSGCASPAATTSVTINQTPSPPVTGSNSPVCDGNNLSLTASSTGATYSWSGPNGFSSASQNPVRATMSSADAGTYSVLATSVAGCTSTAGTTSVTVTPLPAAPSAGSNSPICSGNTLSLTASTISGATYSWTGPNGFSSTLQNPTIANIQIAGDGTYSVIATVNGCPGPAGTASVTINQTPSPPSPGSNTPVCSGQTLSLTANTIAGATYSWTGPNSFSDANQNPTIGNVTTAASGTYSVTATVAGCTGSAGTTTVTINQTPSAPTAGNNGSLCSGSTLSLTASTITGATYAWSGPGGYSSALQNPTIANAQTSDAGTYTVNATVSGCTGQDATTIVTINQTPSAPTAGSNSSICSGQTLSLTASTISGATYSWSGPSAFSSSSQNPTIPNASTSRSGTYSVTASVGGCTGPAGTTSVTVNPTPAITAGGNSPVCQGNTISLNATTIAGASYSWNGPGGFSSASQNPTIAGASSANAGTYTVIATSNAGCVGNTALKNIVVTPNITVNAGNDQTVCGNNSTVTLAGIISGGTTTGNWTTSGSGGFIPGSTTLTGNYIPSSLDTAAGILTLTLTSTNNGGCAAVKDVMTLVISDAPEANAGPDQTVCANNANVSLFGSVNSSATGGNWSSLGTGTFSPNSSTLNATYIPDAADTAAGTVTLVLTTTGVGSCSPNTDTMIVTITDAPTVNAGTDISVCANNPNAALNGISSTGTGTWATSGSGTFSPNAATLNATYIPAPADISAGNINLILSTTGNGNCSTEKDTIAVIFTAPPTVNAGNDVTVCGNNSVISLSGTSSTGNGQWTTSGTGTFANSALLSTTYTPSSGDKSSGSVTITLTTTNNGGCLAVADQLTVTITPAPTANAGIDKTVCANNATVSLTGSFTTASGAIWSSSGSGTFSPDNITMNVTYTPSAADTAAGSVTITLTTTGNGQCNAVADVMVLTISNAPVVNAGINTVACKNNANVPLNGTSTTGAGIWTTLGTGTFTPTATTLSATYNSSTPDTTAGSATLVLTSTNNGGCLAVDDTIVITYIDKPLVFAGNDTTVCSNNDTVYLSGTSNTNAGQWTTNGTGTFFSSSSLNTTYVPSPADLSAGTITFTLTTTNNGTCNPVNDAMVVSFAPSPTANAGPDQTVCANNAVVTMSGAFTISSGAGWTTLGSGTFSPDTSNMFATYTPSPADTAAGSVTIVLTTTGNGGCLAVTDTMIIIINDAPTANAGADQLVCFSNLVVSLNGISSTGSGIWTTLGNGTFANSNSLITTYTASPTDTAAGSVQLVLASDNNGLCNAVTDTMLLTFTAAPNVNAGIDQTVCANNATVTITGTSSTSAGQWTSSGTGTFSPNDSALSAASYIPSSGDISSGTVTIKLTSRYGCAPVSDSLDVMITPAPVVNAGSDKTLCAGTMSAVLNGSVTGGATTGIWTTSGSGTFTPTSTTLNATYNLTPADSAAGSVTLTLTSTNFGNCKAVADQMKIFIMQPPVSNAGPDTSMCGIQIQLYGTITGGSGIGVWSTLDTSGAFSPSDSVLNALFAPSDSQTVLILTSINNGPCPASTDTMVINSLPSPIANTGPDLFICKNNLVVQLNGQVYYTTSGQWSTLGGGTFSPSVDSLNAIYIPSSADTAAGTDTLVLVTTGQPLCNPNYDTLIITFTAPPIVNAGTDIKVCQGDTIALLNGTVSAGALTGQWLTLGSGIFSPNDSTLNGNYVLSTTDTAAGGTTLVLTSTNNGNCLAVTDTVKINITPVPVVSAGSDLTVCANSAVIALTGSITVGSTTGYWSTSGNGIFSPDSSALNAIYTPGTADTTAGIDTLILTSTKGCRAVTDTMILIITDAPFANAGADVSICEGQSVVLNGSINSAAGGAVWATSGNGTFSPNDSTLNGTYIPGSNDTISVTLTLITTGNGQCLAVDDSMTITIGRAPIAEFTSTKICTGNVITFTDASSVVSASDSIVSWDWIIDSGTDTLQNPSHTYSVSGTDSVVLVVTTLIGCTDSVMHAVTINPSPVASFSFAIDCQKDSVFFTDNSSIASGNIISWNWNFGDGSSTSSLQNPIHNYTAVGTYTVTLSIASDSGCTATFADTIIPCSKVTAGFVSTSSICSGQNISFTDTSFTMVGDSIVSWNWNFGDGGTDTVKNPVHTFTQSGTDTITLVVLTNLGSTDTAIHLVTINPSPAASYSVLASCSLDSVYFTDLSSIPSGNIISWSWNFGDTTTSTLQNPVHYYDSTGTYLVSLTVTSDSGCSATFTDTVIPVKGISAGFSYTDNCNLSYTFNDTSLIASGDSIINCVWNYGDGSPLDNSSCNPTHFYSAAGTYTVTHIVTSSGTCSDTVMNVITIQPLPVADFTPQSGSFNVGTTINFIDGSTNATSWMWNFGDGGTSGNQNPSYQFNLNGTFDVVLIASNSDGCPDTAKYSFTFTGNVVAVPSAFTPNGDGINDLLKVKGGPLKEMDWRIYNEWGNELFHATKQEDGWDGTYKGKLQPATRYVYVLKGKAYDDSEINLEGDVTIIR